MNNPGLHINELVLETTRRCHLQCRHCLRGDAQELDMSFAVMKSALADVVSIGDVTFTGGEPLLCVRALDDFRWLAVCEHRPGMDPIQVGNFYLATNGQVKITPEIVYFLMQMYEICDDNEITSVQVSNDEYHPPPPAGNVRLLEALKFFSFKNGDAKLKEHMYRYPLVIDDGRALTLGGKKNLRRNNLLPGMEYQEDGLPVVVSDCEVYVAANGNVCTCCDLSYERIDGECRLGNVLDEPLLTILQRFVGREG